MTFEDNISIMLYACFSKNPISTREVIENVLDLHIVTVRNALQKLEKSGYLERIGNHYRATDYAKDVFNVMMVEGQ